MARRPQHKNQDPDPERAEGAPNQPSKRDRVIDALMALLSERSIEDIGFDDVALRAAVSLADCRAEFGSLLSIVAAYSKDVDRQVLAGGDADVADEPPRERLFDVLMRRLEIMAPRKRAIRSLLRSARRSPGLAVALNGLAVRSQKWMLTAAGIKTAGRRGMLQAQGLALLYGSVLRIWIGDDDPGQARTMAALDRELARGARWASMIEDACRFASIFDRRGRSRSARRAEAPDSGPGEEPVAV
jgi:AcrR family transcriptional regulator